MPEPTDPQPPARPPIADAPELQPPPAAVPPPAADAPTPGEVPSAAVPSAQLPQYKGSELDPARGPGLGCFWAQIVALVALLVATPLTVAASWPPIVSMILLFAIIALLLVTGQTMIFLLRLVAADRGRRRPLASSTRTVGDIEDEQAGRTGVESSSERSGSVRE